MTNQEKVKLVLERLSKMFTNARTALHWSNPLELLVAVILSAQCTDERVNQVTKSLFKKYRSAADYANTKQEELEQEIKPTGFYRNKAKSIIGAAKLILEKFNGQVPNNMTDILTLPGVARKTGSIVLAEAYNVIAGVPVDTHVRRVSQRLSLANTDNPNKIEQKLMQVVPQKEWYHFASLLVWHGRLTCTARKPKCANCVLNDFCPSAFSF